MAPESDETNGSRIGPYRAGFIVVGAPVQHGGGASIFFEFYLNVLNAKQLHDVIGDHRPDVMELLEYQR